MVDAVDSFLNNAVDLYIQAVEYCRISTSQIPTPIGVGIRQIRPESGEIWQTLPGSGDTMPDSGQTGQNLAKAARSPAIWPDPSPNRARWPDHWPSSRDPGRIQPSARDTGRIRPGSG
jgi:hypothetical protein